MGGGERDSRAIPRPGATMNDYQLGVKLRRQILADFERGSAVMRAATRRCSAIFAETTNCCCCRP